MAVGSIISPFDYLASPSPMKGRGDLKDDLSSAERQSDQSISDLRDFELKNPYAGITTSVSGGGDVTGRLGIDLTSDRILADSQAQQTAQMLEALKTQGPGASGIAAAQKMKQMGDLSNQQRIQNISQQFATNRQLGIRGRESAASRGLQASQANLQGQLAIAGGTANIQTQQLQQAQGMAELDLAQLQGAQDALDQNTAMWTGIASNIGGAVGGIVGGPVGAQAGSAIGGGVAGMALS